MKEDLSQQAVQEVDKEEVDASQEEQANLEDQLLRARADLENLRRRHERDRQEWIRSANARLLEDLLPIVDTLQLGLETARKHPEAENITQGFDLVHTQLQGFLKTQGMEALNPEGEAFDPQIHDCVSHVAHPSIPEDHVTQVVRIGYTLKGRLLRPATVIVSKGPEASS